MLAQSLPETLKYISNERPTISTLKPYDLVITLIGIDDHPISYQFWFIRDLILLCIGTPLIYALLIYAAKTTLFILFSIWLLTSYSPITPSIESITFFSFGAYLSIYRQNIFHFDQHGKLLLCAYTILLAIDTITKSHQLNLLIHKSTILIGIPAILFATSIFLKRIKTNNSLLILANQSFFVFALHEPLLTIIKKLTYNYFKPSSDVATLIIYLSIPIITIIICLKIHEILLKLSPKLLKTIRGNRWKLTHPKRKTT